MLTKTTQLVAHVLPFNVGSQDKIMEARSLLVKSFEVRSFTDFEQDVSLSSLHEPKRRCVTAQFNSLESAGYILDTYRRRRL